MKPERSDAQKAAYQTLLTNESFTQSGFAYCVMIFRSRSTSLSILIRASL